MCCCIGWSMMIFGYCQADVLEIGAGEAPIIPASYWEFAEELGATGGGENGAMLWISEHFFNFQDYDNHEMGFYYKVSFSDPTFMADKTKTYEKAWKATSS